MTIFRRRHRQYRHDIGRRTGIFVGTTSPVSIFNSGTIVGTGGTAIDLIGGDGGNTLTLGPGYSIVGNVLGAGADTFQLGGTGSGGFDLSTVGTQYTGFTTFNVVSGTWTVSNVDGQTQAWNVNGGTLAGTGTLPGVNVNSGGTLEPGTIGAPGTFMTITGNLAFQSGAIYLVNIGPATASRANVGGAVTLAGGVQAISGAGKLQHEDDYDILASDQHQRHLHRLHQPQCARLYRHADLYGERRAAEPDSEPRQRRRAQHQPAERRHQRSTTISTTAARCRPISFRSSD